MQDEYDARAQRPLRRFVKDNQEDDEEEGGDRQKGTGEKEEIGRAHV